MTSSFSTLLETKPGGVFVIPEVSPVPDIALVTLFIRHEDGGIRPHLVWIIEILGDLRLVLIGPVSKCGRLTRAESFRLKFRKPGLDFKAPCFFRLASPKAWIFFQNIAYPFQEPKAA